MFKPKGDTLIILLATFVTGYSMGIIAPILPMIKDEFLLSYTAAGVVLSMFGIARIITSVPSGYLYGKISNKSLLIAGLALLSVGSLYITMTKDLASFLIAEIVMGMGFSIGITTITIFLSTNSKRNRRGSTLGRNTMARSFAGIISPAIAGFIAALFAWRYIFLFYAILAIFTIFIIAKKFDGKQATKPVGINRMKNKSILPILVILYFISFVATFVGSGFKNTIIPLYADSIGLGVGVIGLLLSIAAVIHLVTTPKIASLSDRYGRKRFLLAGITASVFAALLFIFSNSLISLIAVSILLGFGTMIFIFPVIIIGDITHAGSAGKTFGLQRSVADLGIVIGPIALGVVLDIFGFAATSIVVIFLLLACFLLVKYRIHEPKNKEFSWKRLLFDED